MLQERVGELAKEQKLPVVAQLIEVTVEEAIAETLTHNKKAKQAQEKAKKAQEKAQELERTRETYTTMLQALRAGRP